MNEWSKQGFHLEHFYGLLALTNIDLYVGRWREAYARIDAGWGALRRSLLPLTVQSVRILSRCARARAAIAAVEAGESVALLGVAERHARDLQREHATWSFPLAKLLGAALAKKRGEEKRGETLLREAIEGFDAIDMKLHAAVARRRLGTAFKVDDGPDVLRASEEWMASEGVKDPDRITAMLAPGFAGRGV